MYIVRCVQNDINPSNIALVLPDEKFASYIQLFDSEKYFNYAMGKTVKYSKLYQVSYAIYSYLSEDDVKYVSNLDFLKLDRFFIDKNIKTIWNKKATIESFEFITNFIKSKEDNIELIEKLNYYDKNEVRESLDKSFSWENKTQQLMDEIIKYE